MSDSIGLYIHIPYCKSKCPYCDFYSGTGNEFEYDNYTEILIDKIKQGSTKVNKPISTIYFGGGTPSVLGEERLSKILINIKNIFSVDKDAEITTEINPETGKSINFTLLKKSGFNRISVGLQSAVDNELKQLGRIHSAEEAKITVERAKIAGINNISLDLMMGIPFQTKETLKKSIDFCKECGVNHISSYILKIEKGTKFDLIKDSQIFPDDDKQAELYLFAVNYLETLGYKQYEISNFAKQGFESRHNINYWKCGEYIGIGPSAHSMLNGERFYYKRNMNNFKNDIIEFDCKGGTAEEFIMLSLRLKNGLIFDDFYNLFGYKLSENIIKKFLKYSEMGFMELNDDKVSFTPRGFLVSNTILSDIL